MSLETGFWAIQHIGPRPFTLNNERKMHPKQRAQHVAMWRNEFALAAMASDLPRPIPRAVHIGVLPLLKGGYKQDVGSCFPTAKAAIDGLVDAAFIPDDGPEWVSVLTFMAPQTHSPENGLVLYIRLADTGMDA